MPVCWFHVKFGSQSKKCKKPCDFVSKPEVKTICKHPKGLYVTDSNSGMSFRIASGSQVSAFPAFWFEKPKPSHLSTQIKDMAGQKINTFGYRRMNLQLGSISMSVKMLIAEISEPIIGSDILSENEMSIDYGKGKLMTKNGTTKFDPPAKCEIHQGNCIVIDMCSLFIAEDK